MLLITFATFLFVISILSNNLFKEAEAFKDPATSLYTMMQLISIEGWYEIPLAIQTDMPGASVFLTRLYFVVLLIVGGMFGMSFINAVLVDAMVMDNNDELDSKVDKLNTDLVAELEQIKKTLEELKHNNRFN